MPIPPVHGKKAAETASVSTRLQTNDRVALELTWGIESQTYTCGVLDNPKAFTSPHLNCGAPTAAARGYHLVGIMLGKEVL